MPRLLVHSPIPKDCLLEVAPLPPLIVAASTTLLSRYLVGRLLREQGIGSSHLPAPTIIYLSDSQGSPFAS
ncbi:protein of unknown function [Candidatus Filomicrobium marinum]|uniref:Uncharacterized protein n=1 Tax=Candidatus Filomicrobium marinum TaxID=1608628 RepID=A0A0D6JG34_9HYPH|nr:protein of unknown function [Candidatus Filomicrobium marinum]CPR19858.1 protein of unknown function [Candidatus Filomicrobium marinum]